MEIRLSATAAKSLARHLSALLSLSQADPKNLRQANAIRLARLDLMSLERLIEKSKKTDGKQDCHGH